MTENDIRGAALAIAGAFTEIGVLEKSIEAMMVRRQDNASAINDATARIIQLKEMIVEQSIKVGTQVLVDINRIAAALEFVATQHNNSEALFKG